MLEHLACNMGRKDEEPNIELALYLCESKNPSYIQEIVDGVMGNDKSVANDCIKVLYEIGEREPKLIQAYVKEFVTLLSSKNNRLVWGGMTALACIANLQPKEVYQSISKIIKAYESGSVITVDQSITVLAKLCKGGSEYEKEVFPLLIQHIKTCRPKEVAQHAERMSICVKEHNREEFFLALEKRKEHLNESQIKRVNKLIKNLNKSI